MIKLWLDDTREPPDGTWTWVTTCEEALWEIVNGPKLDVLSVDHDLGVTESGHLRRTGYDLLCSIEEFAHDGDWHMVPELITIHSMNLVGKYKMQKAIDKIVQFRLKDLPR